MDQRLTFNEDSANYERWRPVYCAELFQDIIAYSHIGPGKKAIEIGIGMGQATRPVLETGCELAAVELGRNLAEYTQQKFLEYTGFKVHHTSFEDFAARAGSSDLIYSGTAFHRIPEQTGYPKVLQLLKTGGAIALFWNRPFAARTDDELHQQLQQIYRKFRPGSSPLIEHDTARYNVVSQRLHTYGFREIELKLYHLTRAFSSADYIGFLNTYSDHRGMPAAARLLLEEEIRAAILNSGDVLTVYDTIDLHLARK
ncbi:methyltransferase domain-containing protein [Paenibacillus sp. FSL H7-0756]|uniref:methyltransferase domain-containing protein n=1 Tax=Paenibacillus sp. FSL H7-0756 TaxID=2954738 RepID=UPI0030F7B215